MFVVGGKCGKGKCVCVLEVLWLVGDCGVRFLSKLCSVVIEIIVVRVKGKYLFVNCFIIVGLVFVWIFG